MVLSIALPTLAGLHSLKSDNAVNLSLATEPARGAGAGLRPASKRLCVNYLTQACLPRY